MDRGATPGFKVNIEDQARAFLAANPDLRVTALGPRENLAEIEDPWGIPLQRWPAEDHLDRCLDYLALNRQAFPTLPLAGWVLSDIYLLSGAIAILARGDQIQAAWVGLPLKPGYRLGVSLLSTQPGLGAWAKSFGAAMFKAEVLRGVVQWSGQSLRAHTRLGPLRIVGQIPGEHEVGGFVYETVLDPEGWALAMQRRHPMRATEIVDVSDSERLNAIVQRSAAGERWFVVPPGIDEGKVGLRHESGVQ